MEGDEAILVGLLVQGLPQLQGPLLGVLLAGIHDVFSVKVNHLLKSNCIDVNFLILIVFVRFINVYKGWNLIVRLLLL